MNAALVKTCLVIGHEVMSEVARKPFSAEEREQRLELACKQIAHFVMSIPARFPELHERIMSSYEGNKPDQESQALQGKSETGVTL